MKNRKLKKEVKLFIMLASIIIIIFSAIKVMTYISNEEVINDEKQISTEEKNNISDNKIVSIPDSIRDEDTIKYLEEFQKRAKEDKRYNEVITKYDEYSKDVLKLLYNNEETLEFVLSKSEFKTLNMFIKIEEECGDGIIPKLQQWDSKWGYYEYGNNILAINGCGPTAVSMVASGLTGKKSITPIKVAKYSDSHGYHEAAGTNWNLMTEGVKKFGLNGWKIDNSKEEFEKALKNGNPIICSVGPGYFTREGHFIVVAGIKDDKLIIHDPNSIKNSEVLWKYDDIKGQIKSAWAYSLD